MGTSVIGVAAIIGIIYCLNWLNTKTEGGLYENVFFWIVVAFVVVWAVVYRIRNWDECVMWAIESNIYLAVVVGSIFAFVIFILLPLSILEVVVLRPMLRMIPAYREREARKKAEKKRIVEEQRAQREEERRIAQAEEADFLVAAAKLPFKAAWWTIGAAFGLLCGKLPWEE